MSATHCNVELKLDLFDYKLESFVVHLDKRKCWGLNTIQNFIWKVREKELQDYNLRLCRTVILSAAFSFSEQDVISIIILKQQIQYSPSRIKFRNKNSSKRKLQFEVHMSFKKASSHIIEQFLGSTCEVAAKHRMPQMFSCFPIVKELNE